MRDAHVDDAMSTEIKRGLEACYDAPTPLTLGKLRIVLEALAKLAAAHPVESPGILEIASVVRPLGLGGLSIAAVASLFEAVKPTVGRDVLAAFTLKELEELLSRTEHP